MPAPFRLAFLALVVASPVCALAQIYVCKDAGGRTITSDRPISECANRAMRELDRNGLTRREIPPPLTQQQQRARESLDEQQRIDAAVAEEQRQHDRALTTRYRNEDDIAAARQRAIGLLDEQMHIDTKALAREMAEMKAAQVPVAAAGNKASVVDRTRFEEATRSVERRLSSIENRSGEIDRINRAFDQSLKRFREIRETEAAGFQARQR